MMIEEVIGRVFALSAGCIVGACGPARRHRSAVAACRAGACPAHRLPAAGRPGETQLPEIVSANGRLRGLLTLSDAQNSFQIGAGKCVPQLLRFFQNHEPTPPDPDKAWPLCLGPPCAPGLATSSS
jgi:hypothetical protein